MRVLAINDISCVGKCSLTAALPIISACGVECTVLPTAVLSTHTGGFEGYTFRDLTDDFSDILAHWKKLGLKFDYIYSGYLGSIHQIELVSSIKNQFLKKGGVFVVDPVMGDSGALYAGFSEEYVGKMRELCKEADFILPNMTEACYLADLPYPLDKTSANQALDKLALLCPIPVITGITDSSGISVFFKDGLGNTRTLSHENTEGFFCGAGDAFASAFIGCMARGKNVEEAIRLASNFAAACIRRSAKEVPDKRFGLPFEAELYPFLQKLNG
ncbi:MAG: pyridoxamine kinase [Clostridiales bacterium]|nr:pyridoxamine kinase [Clostridiales bacterium]